MDCRRIAGASCLFPVGCPLWVFPASLRKQYYSPVGHSAGIGNWEIFNAKLCTPEPAGPQMSGFWIRAGALTPAPIYQKQIPMCRIFKLYYKFNQKHISKLSILPKVATDSSSEYFRVAVLLFVLNFCSTSQDKTQHKM